MATEQAHLSQKGTAGYPQTIKSESQRQIERDLAAAEPIVQAIMDVGTAITQAILTAAAISGKNLAKKDVNTYMEATNAILDSLEGTKKRESDCKEKETHLPDDLDEPTYNKWSSFSRTIG